MSDLERTVRETIDRWRLLPAGDTVVVGVSGGADSLCLLHLLQRLAPEYGVRLYVGHLDHGIRGEEAREDAAFVEALCKGWGLPYTMRRIDVPALTRERHLSLEEAARQARYRFLGELARSLGAHTVAVAHHADDQVETVLMHLLRGSGLAGLRGMCPLSRLEDLRLGEGVAFGEIRLVRPLLGVSRPGILAYCQEHGLQPRFDLSNLDRTFYRNRLRHELLPLLETYNPNIRQVLWRTAEVIAADYALLREVLEGAWRRLVRYELPNAIAFDLAAFRAQPLALQRSLLREAVHRLRRSLRNINWVHIENAVEIAREGRTGAQATLPQGLMLTVGYDVLTVSAADRRWVDPNRPHVWAPLPLPFEGETPLPESDWVAYTAIFPREALAEAWARNTDPLAGYFDAEAFHSPPVLRPRREGDWFIPLGLGHRQKVGDLMTNLKIPRPLRDGVPLLVRGEDVVWVVGYRMDARFAVGPETRRILLVRFERRPSEGGEP